MWWWVIGFVVLVAGISAVIARRGPGDGLDHSGDPGRNPPPGPMGGFGGMDGGGGF
ncbi:hypothetical protein GCM10023168_31000 [Fodinibacter luteus]|uniref:Uncharacterized protein n=1 Tax=Fodinibacter luteus TaxID=552064 RepID=A0ABP8KNC6_9MICO